jgi:hypothetical protein
MFVIKSVLPGCTPSHRTFRARHSSQATATFRRLDGRLRPLDGCGDIVLSIDLGTRVMYFLDEPPDVNLILMKVLRTRGAEEERRVLGARESRVQFRALPKAVSQLYWLLATWFSKYSIKLCTSRNGCFINVRLPPVRRLTSHVNLV